MVKYRVLTIVLCIAIWFFRNGEMRSQESNNMYSSSVQQNFGITKSPIKNQNTQLTEKSESITIRIFPDYPIEKSQYPINKKICGYYPSHQNFFSGALNKQKLPLNCISHFSCTAIVDRAKLRLRPDFTSQLELRLTSSCFILS